MIKSPLTSVLKHIFVLFLNQDEEDSNEASDADVVIESEEQIH